MNHQAKNRYLNILRDINTTTERFRWASDNLARLLCNDILSKLPYKMERVQTPIGIAEGPKVDDDVMLLPIYRAGQSMVQAFIEAMPGVAVGSLLIQRDEKTATPKLFYKKLAKPAKKTAVILDPMLATAGTAVMAVEILNKEGYKNQNIYFAGVLAAQEGYNRLTRYISHDNIVLAGIDPVLNHLKYIDPGLGDYGDRYFGTVSVNGD